MDLPLHPFAVHFPVALLYASGLAYIVSIFHEREFYQKGGFLLHVGGILGSILAIFTGQSAESDLIHTKEIHEMVETHERIAYIMLWILSMLLIWQFLRSKKQSKLELSIFSFLFVANLVLMSFGSHVGGQMVYLKGAGVEPMEPTLKELFQQEQSQLDPTNSDKK